MGLFEELVWTRQEPGFETFLGGHGRRYCQIIVEFDHSGMNTITVNIRATKTSPGWEDANSDRMQRLYRVGMHMWKYVNVVAQWEIRHREMLEKQMVMSWASPHLNMDTTRYVLGFI
mgnify:CR=1 FL=1